MRKRLYEIIETAGENDRLSKAYDIFMIVTILVSIIPLWTHDTNPLLVLIDKVTVTIFIIDYFLRLITADYKINKAWRSFFIYPLTPLAIIDLVSILPSVTFLQKGFRLLKIFRLMRTMKVARVLRAFRYSKTVEIIINVFKKQKETFIVVFEFAVIYIVVSALVMFNAEPETFTTMFDAIYWATISLTTVGYGDLYAVSTLGKVVTMVSALIGVAIVALPAGIIITGYQAELEESGKNKDSDKNEDRKENK